MTTFAEFNLEPKVLEAITELGFEEATPIQSQSIPLALQGRDMIGTKPKQVQVKPQLLVFR